MPEKNLTIEDSNHTGERRRQSATNLGPAKYVIASNFWECDSANDSSLPRTT